MTSQQCVYVANKTYDTFVILLSLVHTGVEVDKKPLRFRTLTANCPTTRTRVIAPLMK